MEKKPAAITVIRRPEADRALHDFVLVVASFNFVNRIASGLAVELEGG